MINKVSFLKKIGGFVNFNSDVDLEKKTIIYAPNGSGKTTLSRLLLKISNKEDLSGLISQEAGDPSELKFEFEIDSQCICNDNYKTKHFKTLVFNSEYIEKVLKIGDFSSNDVTGEIIIQLGKESNEIKTLRDSVKLLKKNRLASYNKLESKIAQIRTSKIEDKKYKAIDKSIWQEFSIDKLVDANTFDIKEPENLENFEDCERQFSDLTGLTDENKIVKEINRVNYNNINFNELKSILLTSKTFVVYNDEIKRNVEFLTRNWIDSNLIQTGIEESKKKDKCLLCKRSLDEETNKLFAQYEEYFSNEESKYKEKFIESRKDISSLKEKLGKNNNNIASEVNRLTKVLGITKEWCLVDTDELINELQSICLLIDSKIENSKDVIDFDYDYITSLSDINKKFNKNRLLVEKINRKIDATSKRKTRLRQLIGKKFLHQLFIDESKEVVSIKEKTNSLNETNRQLKVEERNLPKKEVSENVKKLCNIFIKKYLYLNKYKVEVKNNLLELHLNNLNISKNNWRISEGEKTMIALCYFLASSIKTFNNLDSFKNGIFIIDDPVNSTGYNYFFGVCNLIKYFDKTIVKNVWGIDTTDSVIESNSKIQKIIMTHNTQFFNVLRTNIYKKRAKYLLLSDKKFEKIGNNQLKSEFENSLSNIKKAIINNEDISIGNDLRRFFETIKHFYGIQEFNESALKEVFESFEEYKHAIFYSVVNYYSHVNP